MESLLRKLSSGDEWDSFLQYRQARNRLSRMETEDLASFIAQKRYLRITDTLEFGYPVKKEIAKQGSSRKRTVYSYSEDETWVLKLLTYELDKYDGKLPECCWAFRRNRTSTRVFERIRSIPDLDRKYVLKLDIHDYFNSIDVERLIEELGKVIDDDPELLAFLCGLLRQHRCITDEGIIEEDRGAMAGVPLAGFFANVYLRDLDALYESADIPYFRYSDDMIVFCASLEELRDQEERILQMLAEKHLTLNLDKYRISMPGEPWEYLGFCYEQGRTDLSRASVDKMKARIRRKARRLWLRRKDKGMSYDETAVSLIRSMDRKFYDLTGNGDYTWTGYCFPVIDCTDGLQEIDHCMVQYLRYLYSGRHYKGNYRISYEHLKKLGYTPLVAEYYRWKEENKALDRIPEESE